MIVHPFHPDNGKVYEYVGLVNYERGEYVRCLDEKGHILELSVNITDMAAPSVGGECVMSLGDLLSLKQLVDALLSAHEL